MDFLTVLFVLSLISHVVFLIIVLSNLVTAPRIKNIHRKLNEKPFVSILIPARDEEKNLEKLLKSLIGQSYENYEIIILDDNSADNTYNIAEEFEKSNPKISVIKGKELPEGWLGKNWACFQLSEQAQGDILLFVDADVRFNNYVLNYSLWLLNQFRLGMLTVFPSQILPGFGAKLVTPLMNWLLLTFLPLKTVYNSSCKSFVSANGQFIMIKKDLYGKIGTHFNFRYNVVEDMEMARAVKAKKEKMMTCVGNGNIITEMYGNFTSAFNGFSKNFFPGFNMNKTTFIFLISTFIILFFMPLLLLFWNTLFLVIILMIIFERVGVSIISKENIFLNLLLHPIQMLIMFLIGISSVYRKKKVWKGRII